MRDRRLEHGAELALVARKGASNQGCAELNRHRAGVNRREIVDYTGFQLRSEVGGGGELSFGQTINAVVFDDVDDRKIAAHQVDELADADGRRVAIAAHADANQLAIG